MVEQLKLFVENGGRLRTNEEPKFGEPFYGEYMKQFLSVHYKPGDRVKLQEKVYNNESKTYEGLIIEFGYSLSLLISGRKVHKNKQNKKDIRYDYIKSIEMIKSDDGTFDLSVVDPYQWEWNNNYNKNDTDLWHKKTENRKKQRDEDQKEFHQVYQNVDFEKAHVIKINDGCGLYWPFDYNSISAEVFMIRDNDKITYIPCKTGTPFPNKNSFHAYNCKKNNTYPDLYLYLPDNGFRYENVNIACVWTINTTISEKDTVIKVVNIHHVGEIKPIEDEYNMIFIDMSVCPLLGYGKSLFTNSRDTSLLTCMMNRDLYAILNLTDDTASIVKLPEELDEEKLEKYLFMSVMAINSFELQGVVKYIVNNQEEQFPYVELFCNIDKEPERYYSSAWHNCRKEYQFKMLENESTTYRNSGRIVNHRETEND